ncbi:MAG: ATP-binding protein [Lentisphaerae bacterium]|nr:ATP-binding protein [Lentisphaerota bacterium]
MVFLSGPRQVGKTTVGTDLGTHYLNWDNSDHRLVILNGETAVAEMAGAHKATAQRPILILDELHHYSKWKLFLKGFFDLYSRDIQIVVTGSARLDIFKRGGDSLMGRYFPYRMHPLSVGELLRPKVPDTEFGASEPVSDEDWGTLVTYGGFPEPFSRANKAFSTRWQRLRFEQLVREDIREDTRIRELGQIEALAQILAQRSGDQIVYSSLANEIQVNEVTIRKWISTLNSLFFGFSVRPWSKHVANAIRKTPKWYLRDWSTIEDIGKRNETMVACHLLKAVELWTDIGMGNYDLYYIRDKQKREVDFLVVKDGIPWFLVEVKTGSTKLAPALGIMQQRVGAQHAFQVVFDLPYESVDSLQYKEPVVISARTFLSQLP